MDDLKDFYSINEFAKKLGVHHNTIRRSIKSGRISAFQVGSGEKSSYRIPKSEIQRMFAFDLNKMIDRMVEEKIRNK